jgi:hypothetical protein
MRRNSPSVTRPMKFMGLERLVALACMKLLGDRAGRNLQLRYVRNTESTVNPGVKAGFLMPFITNAYVMLTFEACQPGGALTRIAATACERQPRSRA